MKTSRQFTRLARRHVVRSVAVGLALSLSPLLAGSAPLQAEAPASSVTGLGQGARGDAVRAVQQALVNQGVAVPGGADGIFGAGTAAALKQFQSSKGLSATGTVDQATALALGLASSPLFGLTQGTRSDAVRKLQQTLIDQGIAVTGGADGIFGAGTSAALKQFQTAKGIAVTGVVDAATAAALGSVTVSTPATSPAATPAATPTATPAATPADSNSLVGLKVGARGEGVKRLQQILLGVGYSAIGSADGIFGTRTAGALSAFQRSQGFSATGVVDDATAAVLETVSGTHDPAATNPLIGLKFGASGESVKRLQQTLIAAGVTIRGGADGNFGNATVTAVKAFQAAKGLPQSGSIDEATGNALASGGSIGAGPTVSPFAGLKPGSLGNAVRDLQNALVKAGVTVRGGADGVFGPATSAALKIFQRAQGIVETGVVDDATVAALANPKPVTALPAAGSSDGFAVFGELGTRVIALQGALASAGFPPKGGSDGDFGAGTSASIVDFQRAKGLSVTGKVNNETAAALGLTAMPAPVAGGPVSVTLQVFPVQGRCFYGDSYGYPRPGGRTHLGVDVIAPAGKLIYAVADGRITKVYSDYPGSLSGNGVRLTMADGTYFFYAHMTGVADGIGVGVPVKAGRIIGTVGNSGSSGTPHLHFEVHPRGGSAVNPYPIIKGIDACQTTDPLPQP
jgi:peptidoglycan hydrolase-like protein with peptidoglycan-binding domain